MTQISELPGVTRALAADLASLGLHETSDLLRLNPRGLLHRRPKLSRTRLSRWVSYADLLEVEGMTLATAVALVGGGVDGLDELHGASLARLGALVPQAKQDVLVGWIRDALRLSLTGVVNGNVVLGDGTPVYGAAVTVAGIPALSDGRGRFRVARLPLGRAATVTVHHATLGYKLAIGVAVHPRAALVGETFTLSGRPQAPKVLSQLSGERLPPLGTASMTTHVEHAAPDATDLLTVVDRYRNGDVRCASHFLDFDGGRFVRRLYRLAKADVPPTAKQGTDLVSSGNAWVAVPPLSAGRIARVVRMRAARRGFTGPPADIDEARRRARVIAEAAATPKTR